MIRIQNIYYMLAYAFQVLNEQGYKNVATEEFENTADLCAAILAKGISQQVKRGLGKQYISREETLPFIRGKVDMGESIKTRSVMRKQMVCSYDEFSVNAYMNRIIKSVVLLLLKSDIPKFRKKELKKLIVYFADVEPLNLHSVCWEIQYNRNNQSYRMMIAICYLIVKGLIQTQSDGTTKLMDFLDDQHMHQLYEKFILEYYKKEFPQLSVSASQIPWALDDGIGTMLPTMQSDIILQKDDTVLIIDAKYYTRTTQSQYDAHTLHSGNLYQIFTYVKNKDAEFSNRPHTVSGMLLYAKTDEAIQPDNSYRMSGNKISVRTLDLNKDFSEIECQLKDIVEEHFGNALKDQDSWIDKNKVYAVKMTNHDKANSLALNVEFGYKNFPGICFYTPGERGHMIEGHLGKKTDAGFTFVSEGFEPGTWEFIEVTYDNFKDEYQHIVIAGNKILEQISNTEELIDWYHDNF